MHLIIKKAFYIFLILVSSNYAFSQDIQINVYGTLIEKESLQPVPYATVVLYETNTKAIIKGVTSDDIRYNFIGSR
ncbi:hypothetical protein [Psychroserpens ponticola]|uniref:DUF4369 domain-containing protein n=1 Tax=Psychroserpens ponticola TaxID=2932268 RepID=A0ABY7S6A2_9FLAO|nr:hypothetical protein [Psychroserpens ponticola]WCO03405.1 hypothetical protein MUN68_007835 [Psychroserpens ponticola]